MGDPTVHRVAHGIAYPANRVDGHGEFMVDPDVEQSAWGFLREGQQIGLQHVDGTLGHGVVVESAIHRGPSYTVTAADGSEQTVNTGDWLLAAQFDPETWADIEAGKFTGWSIQGAAARREIPEEPTA